MNKTIAEYILYMLNKHCTIDYGDMNEAQVLIMIIDAYNHEQKRLQVCSDGACYNNGDDVNCEHAPKIENASQINMNPTCPDCKTEHTTEELCPCDIPF